MPWLSFPFIVLNPTYPQTSFRYMPQVLMFSDPPLKCDLIGHSSPIQIDSGL